MAWPETLVTVGAALAGTALGAFVGERAATRSIRAETRTRRTETTLDELAHASELVWPNATDRDARLTLLRFRLTHLGVEPDLIVALERQIEAGRRIAWDAQASVEAGEIDPEDAGVSQSVFDDVTAVTTVIAALLIYRDEAIAEPRRRWRHPWTELRAWRARRRARKVAENRQRTP